MQNTLEILEVSIGDAICGAVTSGSEPSKSTYMLLEPNSQPILDVAESTVHDENKNDSKLLFPNFKGEASKKSEKPKDDQQEDVFDMSKANSEQYKAYKKERDVLEADFKKLMEQRSKLYTEIMKAPDGTKVQKEVVEPYYNECMTFRAKHRALNDTYRDLQVEPRSEIKSRMDLLLEPSEWDAIEWPVNIKELLVMPTGNHTDPEYRNACEKLRKNHFFVLLASDEDVIKVTVSLLWNYIVSVEKNERIKDTETLNKEADDIDSYLIHSRIVGGNKSLQHAFKFQLTRLRDLQKIADTYNKIGLNFNEDLKSWTQDRPCINAVEKCLEGYEKCMKLRDTVPNDTEVGVEAWRKRVGSMIGLVLELMKLDLFKEPSTFGGKVPAIKLQDHVLNTILLDSKYSWLAFEWLCAVTKILPDNKLETLTYEAAFDKAVNNANDAEIRSIIKECTELGRCDKLVNKTVEDKIALLKTNIEKLSTKYKAIIEQTKKDMKKGDTELQVAFSRRCDDYQKMANDTLDKFVKAVNDRVAGYDKK